MVERIGSMTTKRVLTSLSAMSAVFVFMASLAMAQPTVTGTVVSGNPAAPNASFDVLVSISGSPATESVESIVFKVNFDSRKVSLVGASYVDPGFGGKENPAIVTPVNTVDSSFSAPSDPSAGAFRHVAAADLEGTNTLTDGDLLLLTFQTGPWPSAPLSIGLTNPNPLHSADPGDAEPPLIYEVIGSSPTEFRSEYAPVFDNSATLNIGAADIDGDRIPDFAEFTTPNASQTNVNIADSDGDGLSDADDIDAGCSARKRDTDNDGLYDSFEIILGTDPTVADVTAVVDADADGLPASATFGGNPLDLSPLGGADPDDADIDTDGDGYADGYEAIVFADSTAANDAGRKPKLGNVNNDTGVNPTDALICLRLFGGAVTLLHPAVVNDNALDMNRDGQINPTDALIMLRRFGGAVPVLPVPTK